MPEAREVEILNVTRGVPLATRVRIADTRGSRRRGLIGSPPLAAGEGLLIDPSMGVLTLFMSYPIDVVYVDRHDRVIDVDEALPPWRLGRIRFRASYVIELAAGAVRATGTQSGDQLQIQPAATSPPR